jgi:hypothetical protein
MWCWHGARLSTGVCTRGCHWVTTPARLKFLHACGQCHSSRVFTPLTSLRCKLRPNTEERASHLLTMNSATTPMTPPLKAGLAPDGGLYVPETIPKVSMDDLASWQSLSYTDLAFKVMSLYIVRCAFFDRNLHSRIPFLVPTPARLKLEHVCDKWHSSRVFAHRTGCHCKLRPNTGGH